MSVSVKVDASDAIRLIRDMRQRMDSYKPVFEFARSYLETAYGVNFATRGGEVGGWQTYDADYGKWDARAGQPVALVRTGRLMESLTNLRGAPNEIGNKQATFGTDLEYAKFHQYGTSEMGRSKIVFEPKGFSGALAQAVEHHIISGIPTNLLRNLLP
jgi:phage gpG-like protein